MAQKICANIGFGKMVAAWRCQAIASASVDISLAGFCASHMKAIPKQVLQKLICLMSLIIKKIKNYSP